MCRFQMSDDSAERNMDGIGVVLLQMGGPRNIDEVEPFLRKLLSDPDLIRLPPWMRPVQPAFGAVTAMMRAKSARPMYSSIGGGSPLVPITLSLMDKLREELQKNGFPVTVTTAMRFCSPTASEAVCSLQKVMPKNVLLVPLYPHYSPTTAGSSVNDFLRCSNAAGWKTSVAKEWGHHPAYVSLLAEWVQTTLETGSDGGDGPWHILFTAHGLPERYVRDGDDYPEKLHQAAEAVASRVSGCDEWHLSFQSRLGPVKWTGPYTDEMVATLAHEGVRSLIVVPMGFVSDHLETLYEIDILYKRLAHKVGIKNFLRVPAFNDHPDFAKLLARIVAGEMEEVRSGS